MQKQTTVPIQGLQTNPNKIALQPGSCAVANNVVIRKPGVISALPAQEEYVIDDDGPADTDIPVRIFGNFNRRYFCSVEKSPSSAFGEKIRFSDSATWYQSVTTGSGLTRAFQFDPGESQHNFVRNRHIFTEHSSPVVFDIVGDGHSNDPRVAGLPPPAILVPSTGSGTPAILDTGNYYAYRAVYRRVLPDFELVSAPSPVALVHNISLVSVSIDILVRFVPSDPITAGDYVDIYRVPQKATVDELGDDFALSFSYQIQSADILTGEIVLVDTTLDDSLSAGEALYTNNSQQGAGQANLMPPASVDVETFNDVTFYATKNSWPVVSLLIPGKFGDLTGGSSDDKIRGVGKRSFSGDTTNTSVNITNVSNVDGLSPFQEVSGSGILAGTAIFAITGSGPYTVVLDTPATATATGSSFISEDTLTFLVYKDGISTSTRISVDDNFGDMSANVALNVNGIRTLLNGVYDTSADTIDGLSFGMWAPCPGFADNFSVYASNGANYSPSLPQVAGRSKFDSVQDTKRSRVYFSKAQLPEAVAPTNFLDVGKETVLKLWRTQSSLLAFCTDGLWRVTGSGTDWSVDQLDPDCRLVHPDCVGSMNNSTFAWVSDGIAICGDSGAETISTDAIGPSIREQAVEIANFGAPYIWGPHIACDLSHREMWLNISLVGNGSAVLLKTFIFNADTQAFTAQNQTMFSAQCYSPFLLGLISGSAVSPRYSTPSTDTFVGAEVQFNPIIAGDRGYLKQWTDINMFFEDVSAATQLVLTFDDVNTGFLQRTPDQMQNLHFYVPRHCASKPELSVGFFTTQDETHDPPDFNLLGWTARYRVASETIRR